MIDKFAARFWIKVDCGDPEDCWIWTACRPQHRGYGRFQVGNQLLVAHRVAYELAVGPIPKGLCVLHTCDNPPCCNPAHLWLGTRADNVRDRDAKGRQAHVRGEHNGCAKLTNDQVLAIRADHRILRKIAADYNVSIPAISHIKTRKRWAHI